MSGVFVLEALAVIALLGVLWKRGTFGRRRKKVVERMVRVGRGQISYVEGGLKGPTIVLLHGFASDKSHWSELTPLLEEHGYHVVAPDLPGFGGSFVEAEGSYSATSLARQLRGFARQADLGMFHLVGHSIGAIVAASYAYAFPIEVASLTLVEPLGIKVPAESDLDKMVAAGRNPLLLSSAAGYDSLLAFVTARTPAVGAAVKKQRGEALAASRPFYQALWNEMTVGERGALLDLLLPELKVRTLAVFGGKSRVVHPMTAQVIERRMEGQAVTTAVLPDSGHWPAVERPKELAAACVAFLKAGSAREKAARVG